MAIYRFKAHEKKIPVKLPIFRGKSLNVKSFFVYFIFVSFRWCCCMLFHLATIEIAFPLFSPLHLHCKHFGFIVVLLCFPRNLRNRQLRRKIGQTHLSGCRIVLACYIILLAAPEKSKVQILLFLEFILIQSTGHKHTAQRKKCRNARDLHDEKKID